MTTIINADNGVVSDSAGLKTSADSSGVLALQTNGTNAVTIDTSQYVGIGGTPDAAGYKLQVLGSTGITGIQFTRTGAAPGNWSISAGGAANTLLFYDQASVAEKARMNVYGLGIGGAVPSSGMGITFPATQSASSDANTLDDYEEGTWTPTITLNSGTATTYTIATATYTKTGRTVVVLGSIIPTNGTLGSANGYIRMTGLPFTVGTRSGAGSGGNNSNLNNGVSTTFAYSTTVDATFASGVTSNNEYAFVATYFV